MKPLTFLVAALCLVTPLPTAIAVRPSGNDTGSCPLTSAEWNIFPDSSPGAPDFWWKEEAIDIREIRVCDHGAQFLFTAIQSGASRPTALVFPEPSREMLAARLNSKPGSEVLEKEFQHYWWRYTSLLQGLDKISGGTIASPGHARFTPDKGPKLVPNTKLALYWHEQELKLRGYLDVFFGKELGPTKLAGGAHVPARLEDLGGVPEGVQLVPSPESRPGPSSVVVTPNPGGREDYVISLALGQSGPVTLEIFNVAGRRIATLMTGRHEAGRTRVRWDGRTSRGRRVGNGVYFARLATAGGEQTAKFVHLGRRP